MSLNIKRLPGFIGIHLPMTIQINNKDVDIISSGEEKKIELVEDEFDLKVSQYGRRSNIVKVNSNQNIIIKNSSVINFLNLFLAIIFVGVLFINIEYSYKMIIFLGILILLLVINYLVKSIRLEVVRSSAGV